LDFIENHQPAQAAQHQLRILQSTLVRQGFNVKKSGWLFLRELPGERGLSALARTKQRRDGRAFTGCL